MNRSFSRRATYQGCRWNYLFIGDEISHLYALDSRAHITHLTIFGQELLSRYVHDMIKVRKWEI